MYYYKKRDGICFLWGAGLLTVAGEKGGEIVHYGFAGASAR